MEWMNLNAILNFLIYYIIFVTVCLTKHIKHSILIFRRRYEFLWIFCPVKLTKLIRSNVSNYYIKYLRRMVLFKPDIPLGVVCFVEFNIFYLHCVKSTHYVDVKLYNQHQQNVYKAVDILQCGIFFIRIRLFRIRLLDEGRKTFVFHERRTCLKNFQPILLTKTTSTKSVTIIH